MSKTPRPKKAPGINRREFLAGGITAAAAAALPAAAFAQSKKKKDEETDLVATPIPHKTQPVIVPEGIHSDMPIPSRVEHVSGIPLGGIGTGSVEIRPDGYFHQWQIFNTGGWAPSQPEHEKGAGPDMPPGALSFFLRTKQGREVKLRRLGTRSDQCDLYSLSFAKSVSRIDFDGRFPVAKLDYFDETLPVRARAKVFSPFVPHDAQNSGTPGFTVVMQLANTSNKPVEVSLMSRLRNPVAWNADDRKLSQTVEKDGDTTYLTMRTGAQTARMSTIGSLCLSVTGGKASWIAGDFGRYLSNGGWIGGPYGNCHESFLREYHAAGKLPSLPPQGDPKFLLPEKDDAIRAFSDVEKGRLVGEFRKIASFDALAARVDRVEPGRLSTSEGRTEFLIECARRLRDNERWGDVALASSVTLAPGEEKEIRFTLGWFFPHHFSEKGPEMGHRYEHWFSDAEAVNRFLVSNHGNLLKKTGAFAATLLDTSLDAAIAQSWSSQLSTLVKCSWWTKSGQFAIWEGLGCCGFHTTDITYQGSFGILALFPELQLGQMDMGASYQRADGRVHHFFTPDLSHVDNGFDRVDMNPQFVMMVCRDYLWTGDKDYLKRLWPNVVRAMKNTAELDADGDGLPDHDTDRNTYDAWHFFGAPSYIASLWLGSLRAGIRLAGELNENGLAAEWGALLKKGAASFDQKLWNGEYYSLWVDGETRDECCMSDQMSGEWFTNLIGLGHALPRERVLAALKAVVKHNFTHEGGLLNASYPADRPARFSTYQNGQATANWTGIEYAIGSMMIDFGMVAEGRAVIDSIYERYARAGRHWNHVECGDHYYRAMCSWATLLASTGFKVDVPAATLTVAPPGKTGRFVAPWVSSTGWGSLQMTSKGLTIRCASGRLTFQRLVTNLKAKRFTADLAGGAIACSALAVNGLSVAELDTPVTLGAGQAFTVKAG